jgi:hypothetical protein
MEWKHIMAQDQQIQKYVFCWQSNVDAVLGLYWGHPLPPPGPWTVNSAWYCAMLEKELKPAICSKCRVLTNGVVHHDNG